MTEAQFNILTNFIATFFGVLASFSLWYLGQHIVKSKQDRKNEKAMMQEIETELKLNISVLSDDINTYSRVLEKSSTIQTYIQRLQHTATHYAVYNGDIRLIHDREKQNYIRYTENTCNIYNDFANNTEIFICSNIDDIQTNPSSMRMIKERISHVITQCNKTKSFLEECYKHLFPSNTTRSQPMTDQIEIKSDNKDSQLSRIENDIKEIKSIIVDNKQSKDKKYQRSEPTFKLKELYKWRWTFIFPICLFIGILLNIFMQFANSGFDWNVVVTLFSRYWLLIVVTVVFALLISLPYAITPIIFFGILTVLFLLASQIGSPFGDSIRQLFSSSIELTYFGIGASLAGIFLYFVSDYHSRNK